MQLRLARRPDFDFGAVCLKEFLTAGGIPHVWRSRLRRRIGKWFACLARLHRSISRSARSAYFSSMEPQTPARRVLRPDSLFCVRLESPQSSDSNRFRVVLRFSKNLNDRRILQMETGLQDRVALVTGSSQGIGRSIAFALAREGCQVVINGRDADQLAATAAELRASHAIVHAVAADITEAQGAKHTVGETVAKFGTIHILVNNAGGAGRFGSFEDLTDEEWLDAFNLNVLSAVRTTRAALPHMIKEKWGRIINISSESAVQPDPMMPHYNAAKAALNNFTKSLSKAYGAQGILVNTVSPAFIRS